MRSGGSELELTKHVPSSKRPRAAQTPPDPNAAQVESQATSAPAPKRASPKRASALAKPATSTTKSRATATPRPKVTATAGAPVKAATTPKPGVARADAKPSAAKPKATPKSTANAIPKPAPKPRAKAADIKPKAAPKPTAKAVVKAAPKPNANAIPKTAPKPKATATPKPKAVAEPQATAKPKARHSPKSPATPPAPARPRARKPRTQPEPVAAAAPIVPAALAEQLQPAPAPRVDGFRPDLEGLRGIAVVLVLLFHAGLPFVTGGYIGVDVFFVLSGFLITGLLVRELERTGTVSLVSFYARRARRLLPAAAVCLFVTVAISALVLPPLRVPDVSADGVAAALYVSNLRFAFEATDYLASEAAPSPLLHYWSLGVEEQFYLVWPALLLLVARGGGAVVRRVAIAAVVVGGASLVLSLWLTTANAPWAFYSLPTRAWELGIGALLAVGTARFVRIPPRFAAAALWGGLALIALSAVVIGTSTPFPGLAALLPTAGAALVILAGSVPSPTPARSPLDVRPLRFLGRISYSLYLWHWPLLVLPAAALGTALPLPATLALAALTIPIAAASQRWIEEPIRRGTFVGVLPRRNLAMAGAMTLVLVVSAASFGQSAVDRLAGSTAGGVQGEADVDDLIEEVSVAAQHSGGATEAPIRATASPVPTTSPERFAGPVPANLAPALIEAKADRPLIYDDGCHLDPLAREPGECVFGDRNAPATVVLMGDSHAAQWFPALDALGREQHWRLVSMTKSGCPPAEATIWVGTFDRAYTECDAWREAVYERIAELQPALVVVSMTYGLTPIVDGETLDGAPAREVMVDALERTLEHLDTIAGSVALIADTPRAPDDPPVCLSSNLDDALSCATARDTAVQSDWLAEQAEVAREAGATFVDPTPWVCPSDPCPAVIGRYLVYRDTHHLTTAYTMAVRSRLGAALPVPASVRRINGE